jgi:NADPH2:quinone reductase
MSAATFSWELMFTRALFDVDPIQQHYILNQATQLVNSGLIHLPSVEVLPYSLENLKKLHEQQESGTVIGKAVLEMS